MKHLSTLWNNWCILEINSSPDKYSNHAVVFHGDGYKGVWQTTSPKTVLQVINLLPSFLIHIVTSECSDVHQCIQVLNTLSLFPNGVPPSFVSCSTLTVDKQTCSCGYCIVLVLHHVVPLELTKLCPCKLWLLASSHRGTSEILYLLKCMFPLSLTCTNRGRNYI